MAAGWRSKQLKYFMIKFIDRKIKIAAAFFFIVAAVCSGCYNDKEELLYPGSTNAVDCNTIPARFGENVLPLVTLRCATVNCHNSSASGGFIFQNYEQISLAKERIKKVLLEKTMPPAGPLLPAETNTIQCWISNGALNN